MRRVIPTLPLVLYGPDPPALTAHAEIRSDVSLTTNPDAPLGIPPIRYSAPLSTPGAESGAELAFPHSAIPAAATPAVPRVPVTDPGPPELPSPWHPSSASCYDPRAQDEFPGNSPYWSLHLVENLAKDKGWVLSFKAIQQGFTLWSPHD